jgi:transposase
VLMAMYSIRSERAFCERLNFDLLFKWFLDRDKREHQSPAENEPRSPSGHALRADFQTL